MSKPLNMSNNSPLAAPASISQTGYRSSAPRVALGFAGVVLTAITMAIAVILPARLDTRNQEQGSPLAAQATRPTSDGVYAVTSITVVAARDRRSSMRPLRNVEAAPSPGQSETTSSTLLRISSAAQ